MTQVTAVNHWHLMMLLTHHFSNFGRLFLCISFLNIYSGTHTLSICLKKKKPYFLSSSVWAKLPELGRALEAFKFATICKVSSDWPLFIVLLGLTILSLSNPFNRGVKGGK